MGKTQVRTPAESEAQKRRTHANKKKKLEKLLIERPQDIHSGAWRDKLSKL